MLDQVTLTPEQVALLLNRLHVLEARVASLEERSYSRPLLAIGRLPRRLAGSVASHVSTTAQRLGGTRPLPGIRVRLLSAPGRTQAMQSRRDVAAFPSPALLAELTSSTRAEAPNATSRASQLSRSAALSVAATTAAANAAAGAAARSASAVVDLAVGKAVFVANGVATIPQRFAIVPVPASKKKSVSSFDLSAGVAGSPSTTQVCRRVVTSAMLLGLTAGLACSLALSGARAPLSVSLGRALIGGCVAAYTATLGNRVGALVRLAAVVLLTLVQRLRMQAHELRRQFFFVYHTGRWFERLDAQVQHMDRAFYSPVLAFVDNATRPVVATYEGALRRVANDTSALSEAAWSAAAGAVGSVAASAAWVDAQIEERTHWRAVAHAMQQQIASFDLAGFWPHNASKTVSATDEQLDESEEDLPPSPLPLQPRSGAESAQRPSVTRKTRAPMADDAAAPLRAEPNMAPPEIGSPLSLLNGFAYILPRL